MTTSKFDDQPASLPDRQFGAQPLDQLLEDLGLSHHDLVNASTDQLTHKQIQKARTGRFVTRNIRHKILRSLNGLSTSREAGRAYHLSELFNYDLD